MSRSLLNVAARRGGSGSSSGNPSGNASGSFNGGVDKNSVKRATSNYNKCVKLYNSKRYDEAIPLLTECVQLNPQMGVAYALLGVCQSRTGQLPQAMQSFQMAQNYGSKFKSLDFEQGMCASRLGDYKFAAYAFQRYLTTDPHGPLASEATTALSIIQHNCFGAQCADDYLSDACRTGARRWRESTQPLRVYIQQNCTARGYRSEFVGIVQQSFEEWSRGTAGKVAFVFVPDASQAQITVSWTDNEADLGGPDAKELGITCTRVLEGTIESADIKLLTLDQYCAEELRALFPQARCVALHEIGHALGLQHSTEPFDTMFPRVPPKGLEFSLTRRDLNTAVALYSQSPQQLTSLKNNAMYPHAESAAQQAK